MKMINRIAYVLSAILVVAMCGFLLHKNMGEVHGQERLDWYQKAVDGEFMNHVAKDVLDKFGSPDSKHPVSNGELWHYGPSMDAAINAKGGDVVGITIHVNKYGSVIGCEATRKTQ